MTTYWKCNCNHYNLHTLRHDVCSECCAKQGESQFIADKREIAREVIISLDATQREALNRLIISLNTFIEDAEEVPFRALAIVLLKHVPLEIDTKIRKELKIEVKKLHPIAVVELWKAIYSRSNTDCEAIQEWYENPLERK